MLRHDASRSKFLFFLLSAITSKVVTELDKWASVSAIGEYHVGSMHEHGVQAVRG